MSTCNRLDLQTLGSQPFMPKNLSDRWWGEEVGLNLGPGMYKVVNIKPDIITGERKFSLKQFGMGLLLWRDDSKFSAPGGNIFCYVFVLNFFLSSFFQIRANAHTMLYEDPKFCSWNYANLKICSRVGAELVFGREVSETSRILGVDETVPRLYNRWSRVNLLEANTRIYCSLNDQLGIATGERREPNQPLH